MVIECAFCAEENPENALKCKNCGTTLNPAESGADSAAYCFVVECPVCGTPHDVADENARQEICGYCVDEIDKSKISSVKPLKRLLSTPEGSSDKSSYRPILTMSEIKGKIKIVVQRDGVLGRRGDFEPDFFGSCPHISEYHCKLFCEEGQWRVEHLSNTNPTSINGIELVHNLSMVIRDGDRLQIADLFFKIAISHNDSTVPEIPHYQQDNREITHLGKDLSNVWEIVCPVCHKQYLGESESFHVDKCTGSCSLDEVDTFKISKIRPKRIQK